MRRICVITGGSSGIGFQVAKILGNDYQIILAARNEEKLIKATNELKKLDKKAKLPSIIFGYTFGVLGLLIVAINYPIYKAIYNGGKKNLEMKYWNCQILPLESE